VTAGDQLACAARSSPARAGPDGLPRLLSREVARRPSGLRSHLARHGDLPAAGGRGSGGSADWLLGEIERAGLTGRGGAAFPTARKLAAVAAAGDRPIVVVNGTEGEPASAKDKVLMATEPHLVIDGAVLAARITGAAGVVIAANLAVTDTIEEAVRERRALRPDRVPVRVVPAADGFVAGEASAVVNWLAGGRPVPTPVPPRLAQRGLHGRPTLVQNVETLAHLALIARHGARWFRQVGTPAEPGSMLVTVIGAVRAPSVREVAIGTPVSAVLGCAGGPARPLQALLIGGYFGTWVPWPGVAELPFSAAGLAPVHAAPAAGLVAALPAAACGLAETAQVARYLADESAGQCGPCVFGLDAIATELGRAAGGRTASVSLLHRWLGQVDGRGACRHPDGAVRFVRSGLELFGPELDLHARGWCSGTDRWPVLPVPCRRAL
jgi:NADH:ubiquinone oxidoreductase subunit F (NADH-binding)